MIQYDLISDKSTLKRLSFVYAAITLAFITVHGSCFGIEPNNCADGNSHDGITCFFSPRGGCTEAIVSEISSAKQSIHVQAYSFTSAPIAQALAKAKQRGLAVTIILDKGQRSAKYSSADFALNAGIATYIDDKHAIAHNKIMLIDGRTIITGSFNFTKSAENSNAENLLIIRDKLALYASYEANFRNHLQHSVRYGRRASGDENPRRESRR